MQKDIVILTASDKNGAYCVAGIDIDTGSWIRIVSQDEETDGALTLEDLTYKNGERCKVLDCVTVPIIKRCGNEIQPENHLLDRSCYLEKIGKCGLEDVLRIHSPEMYNYILGKNVAQYVTAPHVENAGGISLVLVKVDNLRVYNNEDGKTRADFDYNFENYKKFPVTDREYYDKDELIKSAYLVISLTGRAKYEKYFKCIAKIYKC